MAEVVRNGNGFDSVLHIEDKVPKAYDSYTVDLLRKNDIRFIRLISYLLSSS